MRHGSIVLRLDNRMAAFGMLTVNAPPYSSG